MVLEVAILQKIMVLVAYYTLGRMFSFLRKKKDNIIMGILRFSSGLLAPGTKIINKFMTFTRLTSKSDNYIFLNRSHGGHDQMIMS